MAQLAPSPLLSPAKVQEEIDAVVGAGRAPCTEDRLRMPYTNAVIHELQRFHRTRIENFPRMTTQDVPFRGYTIPKVHSAPEPLPPRDCTFAFVPALFAHLGGPRLFPNPPQ